ncbi:MULTISPECIES: hypothetical protein [unclassified Bradyrhizobium]|uniref:hypothetical protein n=1 Tax=unclassified Bradyrhizobium TaxID=2631580 RepID=UPI002FF32F9A
MTMRETRDPLVGDELIEISLRPYEVHFIFAESVVQLGTSFNVSASGAPLTTISPKERSGNLLVLWSLIGATVREVVWGETVRIRFADDSILLVGPTEGRPRGTIMGRRDMTIEDF